MAFPKSDYDYELPEELSQNLGPWIESFRECDYSSGPGATAYFYIMKARSNRLGGPLIARPLRVYARLILLGTNNYWQYSRLRQAVATQDDPCAPGGSAGGELVALQHGDSADPWRNTTPRKSDWKSMEFRGDWLPPIDMRKMYALGVDVWYYQIERGKGNLSVFSRRNGDRFANGEVHRIQVRNDPGAQYHVEELVAVLYLD